MLKFFKSVSYAFSGLKTMILEERNFQLQVMALILVCIAGFYFRISDTEWCIVLLVSGLVLSLETINSALEKMCDLVTTDVRPEIKIIKDIAAGAVTIACIFAIVIACIIFWPYFLAG